MSNLNHSLDRITDAGAVTLDESDLDAVHGGAYEFYFKVDISSPLQTAFKFEPTSSFTFKF